MRGRKQLPFRRLLACLLLLQLAAAQKASPWKTLNGKVPAVVAKGGFSGIFPDSSEYAYRFTSIASSPATILWCDVRLTKDNFGLCLPDIKLDNCTNIADFFPQSQKTYNVNGVSTRGWFTVDFNGLDLGNVSLIQPVFSRSPRFDNIFPILAVEDVASKFKPPALWLNVQNDIFYTQHNLSMRAYILSELKSVPITYISSPEVGFLSYLSGKVNQTKLIFRFLDANIAEPSTNQTYGSMLKNLTFITTFASGILVPKSYIWPVSSDNYLQPYTTIVMDAHKAGLEIYAGDFASDQLLSYNYSFDPLTEVLSYIDNGVFSVDGFVTDFPITPSQAIGCYSFLNTTNTDHGKPLIFSHNGASGDYPDCTDLAYAKAVTDGADIIDCTVQITKDNVPICMSSINLMDTTTVSKSPFSSGVSTFLDIQNTPGIFTFNLTWDEIVKNLKPQISAPLSGYKLRRNPRYQNAGKFMSLSDFLAFAKDKDLSGISINIDNALFMAKKLRVDMVGIVLSTLTTSGYSNQTTQTVMIQSTESSVLTKIRQLTKYNLVYRIKEPISDANAAAIADIKKFADGVVVDVLDIFPQNHHFTTRVTNLVQKLQSSKLSVYASILMNEFLAQPYDFFSDATVQISAYVQGAGVDGIITDFPKTARRYKVNSCMNMGNSTPSYVLPPAPGSLLQQLSTVAQPPALPPAPVLDGSDVTEEALPSVDAASPPSPSTRGKSGSSRTSSSTSLAILLGMLVLLLAGLV